MSRPSELQELADAVAYQRTRDRLKGWMPSPLLEAADAPDADGAYRLRVEYIVECDGDLPENVVGLVRRAPGGWQAALCGLEAVSVIAPSRREAVAMINGIAFAGCDEDLPGFDWWPRIPATEADADAAVKALLRGMEELRGAGDGGGPGSNDRNRRGEEER